MANWGDPPGPPYEDGFQTVNRRKRLRISSGNSPINSRKDQNDPPKRNLQPILLSNVSPSAIKNSIKLAEYIKTAKPRAKIEIIKIINNNSIMIFPADEHSTNILLQPWEPSSSLGSPKTSLPQKKQEPQFIVVICGVNPDITEGEVKTELEDFGFTMKFVKRLISNVTKNPTWKLKVASPRTRPRIRSSENITASNYCTSDKPMCEPMLIVLYVNASLSHTFVSGKKKIFRKGAIFICEATPSFDNGDESNTIHLKIIKSKAETVTVHDHHVPMFLTNGDAFDSHQWDLATQQILPHIDGINHVKTITAKAEIELSVVKICLQNLIAYGVIKIIPVFQYTNVYLLQPDINKLQEDEQLLEDCIKYVTLEGHDPPTVRSILQLYCGLSPGTTVRDLCLRHDPKSLGVDESHLSSGWNGLYPRLKHLRADQLIE
ncbi:GATOR complex protein NPRL2 [Holothuria leucospilota]|uniref:GATOR complex protein NPRL2 n=1 Tax=Holothuria leucospilota TaxID=206669 RepID=A0A9Q1HJ22_HOLLE|nr:GATOR complex protein NPRL2 [Holothuria leucospilota]